MTTVAVPELTAPDLLADNPGEVIVDRALGTRPPHLARYMLDDDPDLYWLSDLKLYPNCTVTVDLKVIATVSGIRIQFGDTAGNHRGSGRSYLRYSIDGSTWESLPSVTPALTVQVPVWPPIQARYVQLMWAFIEAEDLLAIRSFRVEVPGGGELDLRDFAPDRMSVGNGESVTLSWRGSPTIYRMYWGNESEDVSDIPADQDGLHRWISPPVAATTGFMIQASAYIEGRPQTRTLTAAVVVAGGDEQVRTAQVDQALRVTDGTRDGVLLNRERAEFAVPVTTQEVTVGRSAAVRGDLTVTDGNPVDLAVGRMLTTSALTVRGPIELTGADPVRAVGGPWLIPTRDPFIAPEDGFLRVTNNAPHESQRLTIRIDEYGYGGIILNPGETMAIPMPVGTVCDMTKPEHVVFRASWISFG